MRTRPYIPNRNGWTPERQSAFLAALRARQSITAAAAGVGMSRESAYWLRRQPEAAEFRRQWHAAMSVVAADALREGRDLPGPDTWSTRRLVRWLNRETEREDRAERSRV